MRISKSTIVILLSVLVLSILVANVANLLSSEYLSRNNNNEDRANKVITMRDNPEKLIWFLQVNIPQKKLILIRIKYDL